MSYLHIPNLYKEQTILLFKEAFAMEKIHGTSAHVRYTEGTLTFFSGGEKHERFVALFDSEILKANFEALGHPDVVVYGEAYGGKQQGQSWRYGKDLRFVAFEVKIGDVWLSVPQAEDVATKLGLEFVSYVKIPTDLTSIDAERDKPSEQAKRNGVEGDVPREGIVLRPLVELRTNDGSRVIAKHKRDEERETKNPRKVANPSKLELLTRAHDIAEEWVTPTRLEHVLDSMGCDLKTVGMEVTGNLIKAMVEDVVREGSEEIVDSREARTAIGTKAAKLFKAWLQKRLERASQ